MNKNIIVEKKKAIYHFRTRIALVICPNSTASRTDYFVAKLTIDNLLVLGYTKKAP